MTPLSDIELIQRLLLAAAIGGLIGAERELLRKSAGFRTNILVGLGAAIFTICSVTLAGTGDATRIAAQIVTGMGFLGAGAILHTDGGVHGLTTAATIWVNAAVGMAAGAGEFLMATMTTVITLVVLAVLPPIEAYFERRAGRTGIKN